SPSMTPLPPRSHLYPYTTLFRSRHAPPLVLPRKRDHHLGSGMSVAEIYFRIETLRESLHQPHAEPARGVRVEVLREAYALVGNGNLQLIVRNRSKLDPDRSG